MEPFPLAYYDLPLEYVDILHFQPQAFEDAHAGSVQQAQDEAARSVDFGQDGLYFFSGQNHGQPFGPLCRFDVIEPRQLRPEDLLVRKQQGALGLILCRSGNAAAKRKVGQKTLDFAGSHFPGVASAMEKNEAADSLYSGILRADTVMFEPDAVSHLVQEAWLGWQHDQSP